MLRDASRVVKQQQQRQRGRGRRCGSSSGQLPFEVSGWPLCCVSVAERVCALSVCVHPGCPSLPWLRGFGLGIKLGACRLIVRTAGARMNLEQSSVQIVHSSGKFRAVFFVKFVQFSSFGWISRVSLGLENVIANTIAMQNNHGRFCLTAVKYNGSRLRNQNVSLVGVFKL